MKLGYAIIAALVQLAVAIDISKSKLNEYRFGDILGTHQVSLVKDTPPSINNLTFYLNINDGGKSEGQVAVEHCPENSQICGLNKISLPGKDDIISEIISFPNSLTPKIEVDDDTKDIKVVLNGANWGQRSIDAVVEFACVDTDTGLTLSIWDERKLVLNWDTPAACLKSKGDKKQKTPSKPDQGKKKKPDGDEDTSHWGWFTWLFIFMVLIFAGYIIGNAWINANSTGSNEFLNELVDSLVDVLNRLPTFLKEIWTKVFGDSERGGYSAV